MLLSDLALPFEFLADTANWPGHASLNLNFLVVTAYPNQVSLIQRISIARGNVVHCIYQKTSLPLVHNLHDLALLPKRHARRPLFRINSPFVLLVLHERYARPSRHQPHLSESLEPPEYRSQAVHIVIVW